MLVIPVPHTYLLFCLLMPTVTPVRESVTNTAMGGSETLVLCAMRVHLPSAITSETTSRGRNGQGEEAIRQNIWPTVIMNHRREQWDIWLVGFMIWIWQSLHISSYTRHKNTCDLFVFTKMLKNQSEWFILRGSVLCAWKSGFLSLYTHTYEGDCVFVCLYIP